MNDQSTPNRLGRVATILAAVVAVAALGVALVALTQQFRLADQRIPLPAQAGLDLLPIDA